MPVHWLPPNPARDLLIEALRTDRARCVEIRVTPRMARRLGGRLPVVVDDSLPAYPGFELRRESPTVHGPTAA